MQPVTEIAEGREGVIGVQNSAGRSGGYYVPPGSGLQSFPLLVILHGSGQAGANMIARFRDLARTDQFAIIAPFGWEVGDKQGDVTPDLTHALNCIEWVRSHGDFRIDDSRVLIAGYSGGSSAPYIGSNRPGFTHIAVLHGGVFAGGIGPLRLPTWFSTGEDDRLRPDTLVRQSVDALTNLGFNSVTFRTYPGGHALGQAELRDLVGWWLGR